MASAHLPLRVILRFERCVLACIWTCCVYSSAQGMDDANVIRDQNSCLLENPRPVPNERVTWTGGCKDGFADGDGTLTWYVGDEQTWVYVGRLERGKRNGRGA